MIEPASVVGYVFPEEAVTASRRPRSPAGQVGRSTLAQKHLVRRASRRATRACTRFHHIMIRDTGHDGILKVARADLHTRFVAWADLANRDRGVEFEEILGYHLEQAWTHWSSGRSTSEAGDRPGGARRLSSAGRRAFTRGDIPGRARAGGRAAAGRRP